MDIDRLKKLSEAGDAQAAMKLSARVERTGDDELEDFLVGVCRYHVKRLQSEIEMWEAVAPGGLRDVVLLECGSRKINVIKVIREITGLGLREAKGLVDDAPSVVHEGISREEAMGYVEKLTEVGARVESRPSGS